MNKLQKKSLPEIVLIYTVVLLGSLRKEFDIVFFAPHELLIILLFFRNLLFNRRYFKINKIDYLFFTFYLGVYIIPFIANIFEYNPSKHNIVNNLIVFKIWFVFKIFENYLKRNVEFELEEKINIILGTFLNAAFVSAILGLLFYFDVLDKSVFFRVRSLESFRLATTVGGINTTGVFFALMIITQLYFVRLNSLSFNLFIIIRLVLFTSILFLSGSMTGFFTAAIFVLFYFTIKSNFIKFISTILIFVSVFIIISNLPWYDRISELFNSRLNSVIYDNKYKNETYLPENFYGRYLEWDKLTRKTLKNKPIFGYGFKSREYDGATESNFKDVRIVIPESYYMNILIFGGLFGFLCFIIHLIGLGILIYRTFGFQYKVLSKYLLSIFGIYVLAQLTQVTLQYSTLSEFYGFYLAFISILSIKNIKTNSLNEFV